MATHLQELTAKVQSWLAQSPAPTDPFSASALKTYLAGLPAGSTQHDLTVARALCSACTTALSSQQIATAYLEAWNL